MNVQDLRNALEITGGTLTLSSQNLGSGFGDFLKSYTKSQPIAITGAELAEGDDGFVVTGRSSFFNQADLPITARLGLTGEGEVEALFEYELIGELPWPNPCTLSRSLPDLPAVWNYETGFPLLPVDPVTDPMPEPIAQKPYVDSLALSNARYAVSTGARQDPVTGVPFEPGINLVARMKPQGALGLLEHALRSGPAPLILCGTIRIPKPTEVTRPRGLFESIWSRTDAPGVHLQAALDLDVDLGKLVLSDTRLRIYTPHASAWEASNSTFSAKHGYAARLSVPSANLDIELGADLEWGLPRATLYAYPEGLTLGKLTDLADLAGGGGLDASLPAAIRKPVNALSKLALTYLSIDLIMGLSKPEVTAAKIEVGLPGLTWKVWKDDIVVSELSCRFEIENPFGGAARRSVAVTVRGTVEIEGVAVRVEGRSDRGFTLYAALSEGETIPLGKLMARYTPKVPAPADLTVDSLRMVLAPGRSYSMAATVSSKPRPWVIPVGRSKLTIGNLLFSFAYANGKVTGTFAGDAAYGKHLTLGVVYTIPGDIVIRSVLNDVKLSELIGWFSSSRGSLPSGFDLTFATTSVLIQKQGSDYVFQVGAQVEEIGAFAFEVRKVTTGWGFAAGFALTKPLSELPGLGALRSLEKRFALQKLLLTASSFDGPSFQFPDMAQFNTPRLAGKDNISLPAEAGGLTAGLCVYAQWRIDIKDKQQKMLRSFLGLPSSLAVTLQIGKDPAKQSKLFVGFTTKINGNPLVCKFGAMMQGGEPAFFLDGEMTFRIHKKPVVFSLTMLLVTSGMFLSGTMAGTVQFGNLKLSNLALMTAVSWAGIPSLGIAATLDVPSFSSSIAVMFDSTNPAKSLFAGSISDLTLKDVATVLATAKAVPKEIGNVLAKLGVSGTQPFTIPGSVSAALDNVALTQVAEAFQRAGVTISSSPSTALLVVGARGKSWQLTDMKNRMRHYQLVKKGKDIQVTVNAQIYCAPQTTNIGKLRFDQGFYLNGTLNILGLKSTTTIEVSPNKGIAIDASLSRALVLYKQVFFKLSDASGKKGPRLSVSTFSQPQNPIADFQKPHAYLDGQIVLLGLKSSAFVQLTVSGAKFAITRSQSAALRGLGSSGRAETAFRLSGQIGASTLAAGGSISVKLSGALTLGKIKAAGKTVNLGKIKLDFVVKASADVGFAKNKAFANLSGTFVFQKEKLSFKTALDVDQASLAQVERAVIAEIEKIFRDALKGPEKWAKWVNKGAVEGFKDAKQATKALKDVYRKSAKDAAKVLKGAGWSAQAVGDALQDSYKLSKKAMDTALKGAGYAASTVNKVTASVFKTVGKAGESAAKTVEKGAKNIGKVFGIHKKKKKKKKKK